MIWLIGFLIFLIYVAFVVGNEIGVQDGWWRGQKEGEDLLFLKFSQGAVLKDGKTWGITEIKEEKQWGD